jgi:hypothetical protein
MQVVEAARLQQRHDLKGFGARAPVREAARLAGTGSETVARVDHRGMYAVSGLNDPSSRRNDVEFERPHGGLAASCAGRLSSRNIIETLRRLGLSFSFGEENTAQHQCAAQECIHGRSLANAREQRGQNCRADRLAPLSPRAPRNQRTGMPVRILSTSLTFYG